MSIKKILGKGLATLGLVTILGGCDLEMPNETQARMAKEFEQSNEAIVGTVLEESYQNKLESDLGSRYTLKVKTDDGRILGVSVIDSEYNGEYGEAVKKEALDMIIEKGARISFPRGNLAHAGRAKLHVDKVYFDETYFTSTTSVGNKRADRISVLE